MRTDELLNALACNHNGISVTLTSHQARVTLCDRPYWSGHGKTLFNAALNLAKQLYQHTECPKSIQVALDKYEQHTAILGI